MPNLMLGIEIGNSTIKLMEVSKSNNRILVENFALVNTPKGSVDNGIITDIDVIYSVISSALKEKRFRAKKAVMIVESSLVITRNIDVEKQNDKNIKQLIRMRSEEYLPVDTENHQFDFSVIKEFQDEDVKKLSILLVAVPNSIVYPMLNLASKLKIQVKGMTIPSDAVSNIFNDGEGVIVVDMGSKSTTATILNEGRAALGRYISVGLEEIKNERSATSKKSSISLSGDDSNDEAAATTDTDDYFKPQIESDIISEIDRLIQFYYSRKESKRIQKAYIIGGGASVGELTHYMKEALHIPVEKLTSIGFVSDRSNQGFDKVTPIFANLVGAINGLSGDSINLLPKSYQDAQKIAVFVTAGVGLLVLECAIFAGMFVVSPMYTIKSQQSRLEQLTKEAQDEKYAEVLRLEQDLETENNAISDWKANIGDLSSEKFISEKLLDRLVLKLPEGVTIDNLNVIAEAKTIKITGKTTASKALINYIALLENTYANSKVTFDVTASDKNTQAQTYNITIVLEDEGIDAVDAASEQVADNQESTQQVEEGAQ